MASFLSDARAKLQHNNRVSFAPRDLKALAELISTEKNVVNAVNRLSVEDRKAADALKDWGVGEGDDLADVLSKLGGLFGHLADAQVRFADHLSTERLHHKSVRLREENLASLKKSRDALGSKIQGLEKKVTKMSSENKDLPTFTERLREARGEMVGLEHSVANEEARLADFKRETVREAMGLKLGALLELAEKMTIISELGRLLVDEVPMDRTEPGGVRAPYYGAEKTQAIVNEAQRCLAEVTFNPTGGSGRQRAVEPEGFADVASPELNGNHEEEQERSRFNLPPIETSGLAEETPADEGAYGGFDPRHQSVLPGQSGLPYASDAPDVPPVPAVPPTSKTDTKSKRSGSPPPKLDYDFVTSPIQVNSAQGAPFSRNDYDPIKAAAQAHSRKPSNTVDSYYGSSGDQYFTQAVAAPSPNMTGPPPAPEKSAPSTPKNEVPPGSPRGGNPKPAGRPPVVRGDSALGSRHGFDSTDYGASPDLGPPRPAYGAGSRYNTADANSFNSSREGKRVNAGAFRRPAPSYSTGPSGYQGPPPSLGPSASESIKQQYMSRWSNDDEPPPEMTDEPGSMRTTAPLKVSKRRSITPEPPRDVEGSAPQQVPGGAPPPPPQYQDAGAEGPSTGFGQDRFVTKLD